MPTLLQAPGPPERRAAPRRCVRTSVALGYYVAKRALQSRFSDLSLRRLERPFAQRVIQACAGLDVTGLGGSPPAWASGPTPRYSPPYARGSVDRLLAPARTLVRPAVLTTPPPSASFPYRARAASCWSADSDPCGSARSAHGPPASPVDGSASQASCPVSRQARRGSRQDIPPPPPAPRPPTCRCAPARVGAGKGSRTLTRAVQQERAGGWYECTGYVSVGDTKCQRTGHGPMPARDAVDEPGRFELG